MDSNKIKFIPIRGTEEAIMKKMPDYHDGYIYFATDTKKIYLDANGYQKIPMGTSSSGFYYGIKETTDEEDETSIIVFQLNEIEGSSLPNPDDLLFNDPDNCFYRVLDVDYTLNSFRALRLTVAGSGGSSEGEVKDNITVNIVPLKEDTFVYGQAATIRIIPMAKINKQGYPVDTWLTLTWSIVTSDGRQSISNTEMVKHGEPIDFEFGTKMFPNQYNTISFSLEGPNSGAMNKPISVTYSCVKMDLKQHNEFTGLTLYAANQFNMVCTVEGKIDKILDWYFDDNLIYSQNLTKTEEGRFSLSMAQDDSSDIEIPTITHGSHKVRIELYQSLGGERGVQVPSLEFEIACYQPGNKTPIIWTGSYKKSYFNYEKISVPFLVYNPTSDNSVVHFWKEGHELSNSPKIVTYSTETTKRFEMFDIVDADENVENYYTITSGEAPAKEISFTVIQDPNRKMELASPDNLLVSFDAAGRSNNESEVTKNVWKYQNKVFPEYVGEFENFNWYNNGWILDEDLNSCLRISNGAKFKIPIGNPLKEGEAPGITFNSVDQGHQSQVFEFQFKIRNIQNYEHLIKLVTHYKVDPESFPSGFDDKKYYDQYKEVQKQFGTYDQYLQEQLMIDHNKGLIPFTYDDLKYDHVETVKSTDSALCNYYDESSGIGFCLGTQDAFFTTGENTLTVNYVENRIINLTLVFSKDEQLISIYLNGVLSGAAKNTKVDNLFRIAKRFMIFNSEYCDIDLYKFRLYNTAFSIPEVLNNYAVDMRDVQMYDESTQLSFDNRDIGEHQLSYDNMITYNDEHPNDYLMPYLYFDNVPSDTLPYDKSKKTSTDVRFVNTGLEAAWKNGEIEEKSKNYSSGEVFQGFFKEEDLAPYLESSQVDGKYYVTLLDGSIKHFNNPKNDLKEVSRKFKNKNKDLVPVWRTLTQAENYYLHHGASFTAKQVGFSVQGTSSQYYPRRNYKIKCKEKMFANASPFLNDNIYMPFFFMDNDTVGTTKFTLKIDYMESSGTYNTGFVNMVHNAYTKHPLEDYADVVSELPNLAGHRTNVEGFPAMAFYHANLKNNVTFLGRYNINLDKGSDEVYGFKLYKDNNTFGDKIQSLILKDPDGEPLDMNDVAECWEFSDNNRGYCSFNDPLGRDELSFVVPKVPSTAPGASAAEKCDYVTNAKGSCPQVADSFEYRYHKDEDMLDYLYDPAKFKKDNSEDDFNDLVDDYCGGDAALIDDMTWRKNFLIDRMSNWEKVCKWVWSTNPKQVSSNNDIFIVYAEANNLKFCQFINKYNKKLGYAEEAAIFNTVEGLTNKTVTYNDAYNYLTTELLYTNQELLDKWGEDVTTEEGAVLHQLTRNSVFKAYADNEGCIFVSYTMDGTDAIGLFKAGSSVELSATILDTILNSEGITDGIDYIAKLAEFKIKKLPEPYIVGHNIYYFDTKEYRLTKFKNEFDKHFDKEYAIKYFIMTEVFMCYDSRGKNAMFASWGPQHEGGEYIWYPIFYDLDTQLGINNTGIPSFEYYVNASKDGCYSTNDSVLWGNIYQCFFDDIKSKYQELRSDVRNTVRNPARDKNFAPLAAGVEYPGQDPVEHIENWYTCNPKTCDSICMRGHRPLVVINFDIYYKYISIMNGKGPGYQGTDGKPKYDSGTYLYALQGDRSLSRQQFLTRRINFIDSWLTQGVYTEGGGSVIKFRTSANDPGSTSDRWIDSPSNKNSSGEVVSGLITNAGYYEPGHESEFKKLHDLDADFFVKLKPFQRSYVTLATDNAPLPSTEYTGSPVRLEFPPNVVAGIRSSPQYKEQLLYIYGADGLEDIGDVSLLYPREFEATNATHLQRILLGNDTDGYYNKQLKSPKFDAGIPQKEGIGGKPLLKEVVFTNVIIEGNTNQTLDFQSSEKLEIFRALGMNLAGIKFADGVALHTLHLPDSITDLTLKEARNLHGLITHYEDPVKDISGKWIAQKGLYIKNLTDQTGDAMKTNITKFEIIGGNFNYDTYDLLNKLYYIKEHTVGSESNNLAITLTGINWTPYIKLEKGYQYKALLSDYYYLDNGHYQLIPYNTVETEYNKENWIKNINDGLIYYKQIFTKIPRGYSYKAEELSTYYIDNGSNMLVPYNTFEVTDEFIYDEQLWVSRVEQELIYKKNIDIENNETKIKDLDILNNIAQIPNDKGNSHITYGHYTSTAQTNNEIPDIAGNIYIDNEEPIDESWIKNTLLKAPNPKKNELGAYPNLNIFVKNVTKAYSAKFIKINDTDGSHEIIGTQKISIKESDTKTFFDNPYEIYSHLTHKDNYDFYGWSTAPDDIEKVIKQEDWAQQTFSPDVYDYTFYIIYKKHPYHFHFFNTDGTNLLNGMAQYEHLENGIYDYYATVDFNDSLSSIEKIISPSSPEEALLPDLYTCLKFIGWNTTNKEEKAMHLKTMKSIKDLTFYPVYQEMNVYDPRCVLGEDELDFNLMGDGSYAISVKHNLKLCGKITLPTTYKGKYVTQISSFGFANQESITHIFWANNNRRVTTIGNSGCFEMYNLKYFEMPSSLTTLETKAFNSCRDLFNLPLSQDPVNLQKEFFSHLVEIGDYSFVNNSSLQPDLYLGGSVQYLGVRSFANSTSIRTITFGSAEDPSQLRSPGNSPFVHLNIESITYYCNDEDVNNWQHYDEQLEREDGFAYQLGCEGNYTVNRGA